MLSPAHRGGDRDEAAGPTFPRRNGSSLLTLEREAMSIRDPGPREPSAGWGAFRELSDDDGPNS